MFFTDVSQTIIHDFSIEVKAGQKVAIVGPTGAGKTTMLRCITGMLKWRAGKSLLDGEDISGMTARKLWSRMAYVPQAKSVSSAYTGIAKGTINKVHNKTEIVKLKGIHTL